MGTFIAFIAAIGVGTIISAFVAHVTAISGYRQAWINALRDDLAEFFKWLDKINYAISDYLQDSIQHEEKKREARIALLFAYERIRLRLNRVEEMHIQLEDKLREFLDTPIGQMMADRTKINETVDLARKVLKAEWEATKYPWKRYSKFFGRPHPSN